MSAFTKEHALSMRMSLCKEEAENEYSTGILFSGISVIIWLYQLKKIHQNNRVKT